ncbi:unnamed protein product [Timema podura]|uniref:Uncharacterized protein n=1 Tax=Timema podura TaxID=61482 RepID=A0ABN7NHV7_TIMPD|nr:unnamed protein product [Timema podura]
MEVPSYKAHPGWNFLEVGEQKGEKENTDYIICVHSTLLFKLPYLSFPESAVEHRVSSDQSESPYPRQPASHVTEPPSDKQWNYSGLDLMGSGAAFWQNYSVNPLITPRVVQSYPSLLFPPSPLFSSQTSCILDELGCYDASAIFAASSHFMKTGSTSRWHQGDPRQIKPNNNGLLNVPHASWLESLHTLDPRRLNIDDWPPRGSVTTPPGNGGRFPVPREVMNT